MSPAFPCLRPATPAELVRIRTQHKDSWGAHLTLNQYLEREDVLANTLLTARGGLSNYVLSDSDHTIFASCESIRKDVFVAPAGGGELKICTGHGIGSVFTPPEMRKRGYASTMLQKLGVEDGEVSVLYSDIGKEFYSSLGWHPHPSLHISIPVPCKVGFPKDCTTPLTMADLPGLCELDIARIRADLERPHPLTRIAFLPDTKTYEWHFARAEYLAKVRGLGFPGTKGAIAGNGRSWIVWTHDFQESRSTKLRVLRVAGDPEEREARELLGAALQEASKWKLDCVQAWNVSGVVEEVGKGLGGTMVEREIDSIPSLMMAGSAESAVGEVEWVANERYAWC